MVSLVFLAPAVGYLASAFLNTHIHMYLGRRGIAVLGAGLRLIGYIITCLHPPYPALIIAFILVSSGNGLEDAAWNAWIGNIQNASQLLGFLHGFYGLGGSFSPLIATSMITKGHLQWFEFYYIMVGIAAFELLTAVPAFWSETGRKYCDDNPRSNVKVGGTLREALSNRITWTCALFLLIDVGIEVAMGGWVVVFMMNVRHAAPFPSGMSETGYWLGYTVGRVILGFVTPKIGEKLAILIYFALAMTFHLLFYLVPSLGLSFAAVAIEGFFLGPMFPATVVVATKLIPQHLHVGAIGFAASVGAVGACVMPFAVGAIAQVKGVQVLMPIVLALLVADAGVWACLPSLHRNKRAEGGEEA